MSDANRTSLKIVEETTFNAIPATPAFEALRIKSSDLAGTVNTVVSEELAADRRVKDIVPVSIEAGGAVPMEFSFDSLYKLLEGALYNPWGLFPVRDNDGVADSQITAVDGAGEFTILAAAGTKINSGAYVAGQLVNTSGFTAAGNNGLRRVTVSTGTSFTAGTSTIEAVPPAAAKAKVVGFEGVSGDITAQLSPAGLTSTLLDFTTLGLLPGMWIKIGGTGAGFRFATEALNGWARIGSDAIEVDFIPLDIVPTGWATDAGAGLTLRVWTGDAIREGVTAKSYALEQHYQDLASPEFHYFTGQRVGTLEFSGEAQAILQTVVTFMGADAQAPVTTRFAGATDVAAPTGDVFNTSSHVGRVAENGVPITGPNYVMSVRMNIDNSLRRQNAFGSLFSHGIGAGRFRLTGSFTTYYGDKSVYEKLRAGTATSFDTRFIDPAGGRAYLFDIPRLKYTGGAPTIPGIDQDRMLPLDFEGLQHPTFGYVLNVQRFEMFEA